jgi:hypothetical protein
LDLYIVDSVEQAALVRDAEEQALDERSAGGIANRTSRAVILKVERPEDFLNVNEVLESNSGSIIHISDLRER